MATLFCVPDSFRKSPGPKYTQTATSITNATNWAMREVFAGTPANVKIKTIVHSARMPGRDRLVNSRITRPALNGQTRFKNAPALPW
jgi:hypothetical protein